MTGKLEYCNSGTITIQISRKRNIFDRYFEDVQQEEDNEEQLEEQSQISKEQGSGHQQNQKASHSEESRVFIAPVTEMESRLEESSIHINNQVRSKDINFRRKQFTEVWVKDSPSQPSSAYNSFSKEEALKFVPKSMAPSDQEDMKYIAGIDKMLPGEDDGKRGEEKILDLNDITQEQIQHVRQHPSQRKGTTLMESEQAAQQLQGKQTKAKRLPTIRETLSPDRDAPQSSQMGKTAQDLNTISGFDRETSSPTSYARQKKQEFLNSRRRKKWSLKFIQKEQEVDNADLSNQNSLQTEQPYQSEDSVQAYLSEQIEKPRQNHFTIQSLDPQSYILFCLSCNVQHLREKNYRNRLHMQIYRDGLKIGQTTPCKQKMPPYEWPEYFTVGKWNQLRFDLMYGQRRQFEDESEVETKFIVIGSAILDRQKLNDNMTFTISMEFRGHKMGQLSLKINYRINKELDEQIRESKKEQKQQQEYQKIQKDQQTNKDKLPKRSVNAIERPVTGIGNIPISHGTVEVAQTQSPQSQEFGKQLQQFMNRSTVKPPKIAQPQKHVQENQKQLDYGRDNKSTLVKDNMKSLKNAPGLIRGLPKSLVSLPASSPERVQSPVKLLYPRPKAGFFKVCPTDQDSLYDGKNMAQLYSRTDRDEPTHQPRQQKSKKQEQKDRQTDRSEKKVEPECQETLIFNTIIFKNFLTNTPTNDTYLVVRYASQRLETQKIHEKDVLWCKQSLTADFSDEDQPIEFTIFEEVEGTPIQIGKSSIPITQIRFKLKMYSYKLPVYQNGNVVGELLLHYEFKKKIQAKRKRVMSLSVSAHPPIDHMQTTITNQDKYLQRLNQGNSFSSQKIQRKWRQQFYYSGKNVKFGQAPRFRTESLEQAERIKPGPGSYKLPSVFDRHKVIQ